MSDDIRALLAVAVDATKLKILVFGPQVHTISADVRTAKLQLKRKEIRQKLEAMGHHVKYAEDLVDPTIPGPAGNASFQEAVIMSEYDLIVTIVDSPGTISEATIIAHKPHLCPKASLFLDETYNSGFVGETCQLAEHFGANFKTYSYPGDLDGCHLMGFVHTHVTKIQMAKYLL